MAAGPVGVKHPAKKFYTLAALMFLLAWVLSLIAIFVPWSWKDVAVFNRLHTGLWENCNEFINLQMGPYTCRLNNVDIDSSVSGGSKKCRGYIVAAQVFAIAGVCFAFLALILSALIMGKLWSKPVYLALYTAMIGLLAFGTLLVAFLMWIVYAETDCQPGNPKFPVSNYSWGWVLEVCATAFALLGMLLVYLGLYSILKFKPFIPHEEPPMYPVMEAPMYPDAPMYPNTAMYPMAPSPYMAAPMGVY